MVIIGVAGIAAVVLVVALFALRGIGSGANPALVMGLAGLFVAAGAVGVFSGGELSGPLGVLLIAMGLVTGISAVASDARARTDDPHTETRQPR